MKADINKIYDIVEAKVTDITGLCPNATDKDLGLDSLDTLEIVIELENNFQSLKREWNKQISNDMSVLEITLLIYELLKEYDQDT